MNKHRPFVLSLAGLDPSAGAGLLADIKTMEQIGVYGLGVCTALTAQNEDGVQAIRWTDFDFVLKQLESLFQKYAIKVCKIGIVPNWQFLEKLIHYLLTYNKELKIIVDPIFRASAGFDFMPDQKSVQKHFFLLKKISLLTPNAIELRLMNPQKSTLEARARELSHHCSILLKGGHRKHALGVDQLYEKGKVEAFFPQRTDLATKHGSGCVLSAAITSHLALGKNLRAACRYAKSYISTFLKSHPGQLGWHNLG